LTPVLKGVPSTSVEKVAGAGIASLKLINSKQIDEGVSTIPTQRQLSLTLVVAFAMADAVYGQAPNTNGTSDSYSTIGLGTSGTGGPADSDPSMGNTTAGTATRVSNKTPSYLIAAKPNPAAPGQTITFDAFLNPEFTASHVKVALTFLNSAGAQAGQATATGVDFVAGRATRLTITYSVPKKMPPGTYKYSLAYYDASNAFLGAKANAGHFSIVMSDGGVTAVCATAVVVGLQWLPVSGAEGYIVARNGANLTSASTPISYTYYTDQTVAPSTSYTYSVTAVNSTGEVSASSVEVMTQAPTPNGDAAYCHSSAIWSMMWNWSSGFNQQNSSDLWAQTWGADGNDYAFFGDGLGFFGSGAKLSFGIGELTGAPGPIAPSDAINVYGGENELEGKATSLLAVGSNYYAIGSVWQSTDPPNNGYGAPGHVEIEYSPGNPSSWQSNYAAWTFCVSGVNPSGFCPGWFLQYGPGYAGAEDSYVYIYGMTSQSFFGSSTPGPAYTYLFRVPSDQILSQQAYEAFTGLDNDGNPLWSSTWTDMQPVFTDRGPQPMGISAVVYNSALGRFIAEGQGGFVNQAAFYDAPNPWGPWTSIGYYNSNADNTGGWGNLGTNTFTLGQTGDSLGINFINKWSTASTMWAVFSSDGIASTNASLPSLAGQSMDSFSLVSVTLLKVVTDPL
jgi:hypothetical protein